MHSENIVNQQYEMLNLMRFGYESCAKSHAYGPATRLYWLFHYVVSGKGTFKIGKKEYALTAGMMFVIPPYEETYYEADAEDPWEYIWVGFTGTPPIELEDTYTIPQAVRIFERMKACENLQKGKMAFILANLWELFSILMEESEYNFDPVDTALNLIHAEYMTPLTIQQIADNIHLERTYFSNLFCKRLGISPKQYLLNYRMEQALFLLERGYSVSVSAASVGYRDIYTFSKMFKKHFGKAPSHFLTHKRTQIRTGTHGEKDISDHQSNTP